MIYTDRVIYSGFAFATPEYLKSTSQGGTITQANGYTIIEGRGGGG